MAKSSNLNLVEQGFRQSEVFNARFLPSQDFFREYSRIRLPLELEEWVVMISQFTLTEVNIV